MMIFQGLIVFAVIAANIHFEWGGQGYAPAAIGIALAWVLTAFPAWVISRLQLRKANACRRQTAGKNFQQRHHGELDA